MGYRHLFRLGVLACVILAVRARADVNTWSLTNPVFGTADLEAVVRSDTQWIVVGGGGHVGTSPDGRRWTPQVSGTSSDLGAVTFGSGRSVIGGVGGLILTSNNGTAWSTARAATIGSTAPATAAVFGNGTFVVTLADATILTSTDGTRWTQQIFSVPDATNTIYGLTFGGGQFIAVGGIDGTTTGRRPLILTSPDGTTWTRRATELQLDTIGNTGGIQLFAVAFGGGQYVAVGESGGIATSNDGISWISRRTPNSPQVYFGSIAYGDGLWVADNVTSNDGVVWKEGPRLAAGTFVKNVSFANGIFVAAAVGGKILRRTALDEWSLVSGYATPRAPAGITYGNGLYVVTGLGGATAASNDGYVWRVRGEDGYSFQRVTFGNGLFVTSSDYYQRVATSSDGVTWTIGQNFVGYLIASVFARGRFVGCSFGYMAVSPDGVAWTKIPLTSMPSRFYTGIAEGSGLYVSVGTAGSLAVSPDGTNWTERTIASGAHLSALAFGAGRFIAAEREAVRFWSSLDATTWTVITVPAPSGGFSTRGGVKDVIFAGGRFVATAGTDIITSTDGVVWSVVPRAFGSIANSQFVLAYGNGTFLAAGDGGLVYKSASDAATIAISTTSTDAVVASGQTATLSVTATGTGLTYQWYRGMTGDTSNPIAGATSSTFTSSPLTQDQRYWVRVSASGTFLDSSTITLRLATAPVIVAGKREWEVVAGNAITLSAQVSGTPVPTVQWYQGRRGDISKPVFGANGASLTLTPGAAIERYWLRATNASASADSEEFHVAPWQRIDDMPYLTNVRRFGATLVGVGGETIVTSEDNGATWTQTASIFNSYLEDIAHGGGVYVAVGGRGYFSSPDLVKWTPRNLPSSGDYRGALAVAFGNGVFVATGVSTSYVSTDGTTWSPIVLPSGVSLSSVVFDGVRFVAVGSLDRRDAGYEGVGIVVVSTDGMTWSRRGIDVLPENATSAGTALDQIAFVGGKFLATSSTTRLVLVSPDSANWMRVDLKTQGPGRLKSAGFINGRFVLTTDSHGYLNSTDAITWAATAAPFQSFPVRPRLVPAPSGELLAIGQNELGPAIAATRDGVLWMHRRSASGAAFIGLRNVIYGGGRALAIGPGSSNNLYVSEDGRTWRLLAADVRRTGPRSPLAFAHGRFYGAGSNRTVLVSPEGTRWRERAVPGGGEIAHVAVAGDRVFALGSGGFATSVDGEAWSFVSQPGPTFNRVTFGNGTFVLLGGANGRAVVLLSGDGVTWRAASTPPVSGGLEAIAFGNGVFIAVGYDGYFSSRDGDNWTKQNQPADLPHGSSGPFDALFLGDRFFATVSGGIAFSVDGITWRMGPTGPGNLYLTPFNGSVLAATSLLRARDEQALTLTTVSADQEVVPGASTTLSVSAVGTDLHYQWHQVTGDRLMPIVGASSASFTTPPVTANARYVVHVTGSGAALDSRAILVAVAGPPMIARSPFSTDIIYPGPTLGVEVESVSPLAYQWFVGDSGDESTPIPNATAPTYIAPHFARPARFWVRVNNRHGAARSAAALVTPWVTGSYSMGLDNLLAMGLAYGRGQFVAAGRLTRTSNTAPVNGVATSADGAQWTISPINVALGPIAFGVDRFVALGSGTTNHTLYISRDGLVWEIAYADRTGTRFSEIYFVGERFLAMGSGGKIAVSADGATWAVNTISDRALTAIAFGRGVFVAAGAGGKFITSTDAMTWSPAKSATNLDILGVAFAAGKFIATAVDGTALTSSDGSVWTKTDVFTSDNWDALPPGFPVVAAGDRFIGRAPSLGGSFTSLDGTAWGATFDSTRIVSGGGYAVAFAPGSTSVYQSLAEAPVAVLATPTSQIAMAGDGVVLSVIGTGSSALAYQWAKDGVALAGATSSTLLLSSIGAGNAGPYTVTITNAAGDSVTTAATVTLGSAPPTISGRGRLINLSILTELTPGGPSFQIGTAIGGVTGAGSKAVVLRAAGPSLASFNIANPVAEPRLAVLANGTTIASNSRWGGDSVLANAMARVGAFPFLGSDSRDAALAPQLPMGNYVLDVSGVSGASGKVLAELYDASPAGGSATARLVNISVLKHLGAGLVVGFVVGGGEETVLIRVVGPGLAPFNVGGTVADPKFDLFDSDARRIDGNDNWGAEPALSTAFRQVGAFDLPSGSRDAALVVTLNPGNYTVQANGTNNATGTALIEIYEVK
jgi:hypothetical protein